MDNIEKFPGKGRENNAPKSEGKKRVNGEDGNAGASDCLSFGEDALALEFTRQHGDDWRYVASWGKWLHWDGVRWKVERTLAVFDLARKICRASAALEESIGRANAKSAAKTVAAVENLARSDRTHALPDDIWDADLWALNTPGGIVNLKTREIRPHRREEYMTRVAGATPTDGEMPLWRNFLHTATGGDTDLQGYLARAVGYMLTGLTTEDVFFFLHGPGGNGKTVFEETIRKIMGDYATTARADSFTASKHEQHPTDLASLRGARAVLCNEIERGKRWAEAKLCEITGGAEIRARFMRQDEFTYTPQFKLMIAGNHKPGIRSVNEAIRRRLHLIPFTAKISEADKDRELKHKLWDLERDEIMRWAVQGCAEWQEHGLKPPAIVKEATEQYLSEEDALGSWLEDCCEVGNVGRTLVATLHNSWAAWCEREKQFPTGRTTFARDLEARGLFKKKEEEGIVFHGVRVKPAEVPPAAGENDRNDW